MNAAGVRFVHFTRDDARASKFFAERLGLETVRDFVVVQLGMAWEAGVIHTLAVAPGLELQHLVVGLSRREEPPRQHTGSSSLWNRIDQEPLTKH